MSDFTRRDFMAAGTMLGGALALQTVGGRAAAQDPAAVQAALVPGAVDENGKYVLPKLLYPYDAVSEVIDEQTMMLHHSRHHQGYVNGLIKAEGELAKARESGDFALVDHWSGQCAFHGGGHFLHCIFWDCIGPDAMGGKPTGELARHIERDFGGLDAMLAHFAAASKSVQGSGWGIVAYSIPADKLIILQGQNQQLNTQWGMIPILVNDVWEHAYYLKYQNNRGAYVDAFPKIINWSRVGGRFDAARAAFAR